MTFRNVFGVPVRIAYGAFFCGLAFFALGSIPAHADDFKISVPSNPNEGNIAITIEDDDTASLTYRYYFDGSVKSAKPKKVTRNAFSEVASFDLKNGPHTLRLEVIENGVTLKPTEIVSFFVGTEVPLPAVGIPKNYEYASRNTYPFYAITNHTEVSLIFNCAVPNKDHTCKLYQNGKLIKSFEAKSADYGRYTVHVIENLKPHTSYTYNLVGYEKAGSLPDRPRVNSYEYTPTLTVKTQDALPPKDGVTCMSLECRGKDKVAPSVPKEFMVTEASSTQLVLTWVASSDTSGIKGYNIYRNRKSTPVNDDLITSTMYTDTGLKPSSKYQYAIEAVDNAGNVSREVTLEAETTALVISAVSTNPPRIDKVPPVPPKNFTAVASSTTGMRLTWTAATDASGIKGYNIYRNNKETPINATLITDTSYNDSGLLSGKNYTYHIVALDKATVANQSEKVSTVGKTGGVVTVLDTTVPTTPTNFKVTSVTPSSIALSWTASTDAGGLKGYYIYRNNATTPINNTVITGTAHNDTGLTANTSYTYSILAVDLADNRSQKATVSGKTAVAPTVADTIKPTTPTNFRSTGDTTSSITLAWNASTDAGGIKGYNIFRGTGASPTLVEVLTPNLTITETGLTASTSYTYKIEAVDNAGNKSTFAVTSAKTDPAPVATTDTIKPTTPTNFRATGSTTSSITLAWNASTDAGGIKGYNVMRGAGAIVQTVAALTPNVTVTDTGLSANESYTYKVEAVDNAGNKSPVVVINARTAVGTPVATVQPACTLTSNKSSYTLGETITYSWTSTNATFANWKPDTSGKETLAFPGDKLTASGTQKVVASVIGTVVPATLTITGLGGTATCSKTVSITAPVDTAVPSAPSSATVANLKAVSGSGWQVDLSWGAAMDNVGVTGYVVRSLAPTESTLTTTSGRTYTQTGLVVSGEYTVSIQAKDARGNLGPARLVKYKLNFAGMGVPPTIQIISNTIDTFMQKVVTKPTGTPLVGGSTKEATLASLMEQLTKLKAQLETVK